MSYGSGDTDAGTRCGSRRRVYSLMWGGSACLPHAVTTMLDVGGDSFVVGDCVYLWIDLFFGYKGFFSTWLFVESVEAFSSCNEKLTMSQFLFSLYLMCTKPLPTLPHKTHGPCGGEGIRHRGSHRKDWEKWHALLTLLYFLTREFWDFLK